MRGFPLINAILVAVCLGVFVIPLIALTGIRSATQARTRAIASADEQVGITTWVTLRTAHTPLRARVSHLGEELWKGGEIDGNRVEFEIVLRDVRRNGGIDLLVAVEWPEGTPETVVELTLEPDGLETRTRTAWGTVRFEEVLSFTW